MIGYYLKDIRDDLMMSHDESNHAFKFDLEDEHSKNKMYTHDWWAW
jgi:hypothetical protein